MNKNSKGFKDKIIKTFLSLMISFLIIFIVAMFARVASNTVFPSNSKAAVLINDYLDMMMQMVDKIAVDMNIKRNTVSEYQVNLISQSISDYVGYSMYQTADIVKNYNPRKSYSRNELESYKNDYYKMTLENPYLRGMTIFSIDGKMRLNLYLSKNKSWPLELQDTLIKEIIKKGSLVLNATNENTFYIMEYIKNSYGEMIVATRNDYSYISDIAMYYQVADKRLYVSDSRNLIHNVRESVGDNTIEKVSSVINRFAYYKKQPSFVVNDSLSVSMIGKEYPNYFELIVLAITALLILFFQLLISGVMRFFKYIMQIKSNKDYMKSLRESGEVLGNIEESIINVKLPKSDAHEDMPPMIEKIYYKIPQEYKDTKKEDDLDIEKEILNIISNVKDEIDIKNDASQTSATSEEIKISEENKEEEKIDENCAEDSVETPVINEENREEIYAENSLMEMENEDKKYEIVENMDELEKDIETSAFKEQVNNDETIEEEIIMEKEITKDENKEYAGGNAFQDYEYDKETKENQFVFENKDSDLYGIKKELEDKEYIFNKENYPFASHNEKRFEKNDEVDKEILNSYDKVFVNDENEEENKENKSEIEKAEDVFAAFDKMLASIISKAEEDAKSITKK